MNDTKFGLEAVAAELLRERQRQVVVERFTRLDDDGYVRGELAQAAICYLMNAVVWAQCLTFGMTRALIDAKSASAPAPATWPWQKKWWKPKSARENLVRAGALIIAEIERLDRAAAREQGDPAPSAAPAQADKAVSAS